MGVWMINVKRPPISCSREIDLNLNINIPHPLSAGSLASNSKSKWEGGGYDN
jgi:hypothetical protein